MRLSFTHLLLPIALLTFAVAPGCKEDKPAPAPAPTAPAATPAAAAPKPAATNTAAAAAKKKSLPEAKQKEHPVPADWVELQEPKRGFSLSVPKDTKGEGQDKDGMLVYGMKLAAPHDSVEGLVIAFKDAKKTKADLAKDAHDILEKLGVKDYKAEKTEELGDDYDLITCTFTDEGKKSKGKILIATDVTDNYMVIVGAPEDKFKESEKTIDEIWASFDMWSDK